MEIKSTEGIKNARAVQEIEASEQINRLFLVSRNQQELMASLLQGSKIILEYPEFKVSGKMLFEKCKNLTRASCGFISIMDPKNGDSKIIVNDRGCDGLDMKMSLPDIFKDLRNQATEGKCSVLENEIHGINSAIKNVLLVPLIHNQIVVGLLLLANKTGDFNAEDVAVAEGFAELAALAWLNSKNMEDLTKARLKAEESDRLKSAFLSNMSHEIRTPLNGILGFSELLTDPDLDVEEREQYVRIMNQNGEQLMDIINNILDISLIESGQIVLFHEWVDLQALIREVHELFLSPGLNKNNIFVGIDCQSVESVRLYTDSGRLKQILVNLFGNALKFTSSGHVIIGCRLRNGLDGPEVAISINDTGIGISADKLEAIFERFRQADRSTKKFFGGTGLGLAISKGLTELLGGRIEVVSKLKIGSTFSVIFPLAEQGQVEVDPCA